MGKERIAHLNSTACHLKKDNKVLMVKFSKKWGFPDECHGCFSNFVREQCKNCADHQFLECATKHKVKRCYECKEFPCDKLKGFSTKPIINGFCNHANVIQDSLRMKEVGVAQWINEKIAKHKCPKCSELINWYEMTTHTCD